MHTPVVCTMQGIPEALAAHIYPQSMSCVLVAKSHTHVYIHACIHAYAPHVSLNCVCVCVISGLM